MNKLTFVTLGVALLIIGFVSIHILNMWLSDFDDFRCSMQDTTSCAIESQ